MLNLTNNIVILQLYNMYVYLLLHMEFKNQ